MSIVADVNLIKKLRDSVGAGMSACKDALMQAGNDYDAAVKILREKGMASAAKKGDRETKEGVCAAVVVNGSATLVKIGCETDFVVRNDQFQHFAKTILDELAKSSAFDVTSAQSIKLSSGNTLSDEIREKIGVIGENIVLADCQKLSGQNVVTYIHSQVSSNLGRIAVAVALESSAASDKLQEIGKQVCMHIAAFSPQFLSTSDITNDFIESEKEIYRNQLADSGKPQNILEKIIDGKMQKTFQDVVLLEQAFAIDPSIKVKEFLEKASKEIGHPVTLTGFKRLAIG